MRALGRYFKELEQLFIKCNITTETTKKEYASHYVPYSIAELWECLSEFGDNTKTYDQFKAVVLSLYPGASATDTRRWTKTDFDRLWEDRLRKGIRSIDDLSEYYHGFYKITQYLIAQSKMSQIGLGNEFARGFQSQLYDRVFDRLSVKFPDRYRDDPYTLSEVYETAKFVLHGPVRPTEYPGRPESPRDPQIKSEEVALLVDRFDALIKTLSAQQPQSTIAPAQRSTETSRDYSRPFACIMCGAAHGINWCKFVTEYIMAGKVKRNAEGKVVLPNGEFVPRGIPGEWLRDRVDEWHRQNPGQLAKVELLTRSNTEQLMLAIDSSKTSAFQLSTEDRIASIEQEIMALRAKEKFDAVELPRRRAPAKPQPTASESRPVDPDSDQTVDQEVRPSTPAPEPTTEPQAPVDRNPVVEPPIHPYRNVREPVYRPPHERNLGSTAQKGSKDKEVAYRSNAPIQDPKIADDVYKRYLANSSITLSTKELLALSPEVRSKIREAVSTKRIANDNKDLRTVRFASIEEDDVSQVEDPLNLMYSAAASNPDATRHFEGYIIKDDYDEYLRSLPPGEVPEEMYVAKESAALRSINLLVGYKEYVESILDPGSQIIAMSEAVSLDLGIHYDPIVILKMQSANGSVDPSLGLARNVPCQIGSITVFLQIHILREPAYDILLGRPFDIFTRSTVQNYANEDQTITIHDPNTGQVATVPTFPRKPPKHCCPKHREELRNGKKRDGSTAVNFRQSRN